jgi:hypothetical protein
MLEFAEALAALRREMKAMRDRGAGGGMAGGGVEDRGEAADERPPHY